MKKYFINGQEIHQIGDYVSVVWNLDENENRIVDEKPYINFLYIKQYSNGFGVSEDSSVAGGIGVGQAEAIIQELTEAVAYIHSLKESQKDLTRETMGDFYGSLSAFNK